MSTTDERTPDTVHSQKTKAWVRRFYEEIDPVNIGIIDELVAEDYIDHTRQAGREAVGKDMIASLRQIGVMPPMAQY